jgi:hypothetical protein
MAAAVLHSFGARLAAGDDRRRLRLALAGHPQRDLREWPLHGDRQRREHSLNLTGDAYPGPPLVTLTGGAWSGGKYVVDPAQPITLTTSTFATYGTHAEDAIAVGVDNLGSTELIRSANPGANSVTFTIPPNTLVAGQEYEAGAYYAAGVDVHPVAAFPGSLNAAIYSGGSTLIIKAQTPIFPMTVNANIGPTVSNATANIQYRPQDVGTTAASTRSSSRLHERSSTPRRWKRARCWRPGPRGCRERRGGAVRARAVE